MMIPVNDLFTSCQMMLKDKWGYIWGTSGQVWTEAKQKAATREMTVKYGSKWIGHRVADCSGVPVYIWKQHGMTIPHGSNSIRRKSVGTLTNVPKPGYAAFKVRNGDDYYHIGIVAEDGLNVYEARGTQAGFVMSAASSWHVFAPFLDVQYEGVEPVPEEEVLYQAMVVTESGNLNLRSGPGTNYAKVAALPRGSTVNVLNDSDPEWWKVSQSIYTGYASSKYLKRVDDAPDTGVYTILRNTENSVTIGLHGEWEVYAVMGKDDD